MTNILSLSATKEGCDQVNSEALVCKEKNKEELPTNKENTSNSRNLTTVLVSKANEEKDPTENENSAACPVAFVADKKENKRNLICQIVRGQISNDGEAAIEKIGGRLPADLKKAWKKVRDSKNPSYHEVPIKDLKLPCTLDEFFEEFLSNDAKHSMENYQRNNGDKDLEVSSWQLSEDDAFSLARSIKYIHPINAPAAPSKAAAVKKQRFQRYGNHGMLLLTQTIVKDVPLTDCFYMDEQILLEPQLDGNGILFTMMFDVRFIKRTIFRLLITRTTKVECVKGSKHYCSMIKNTLNAKKDTVRAEKTTEQGATPNKVEIEEDEKEKVEVVSKITNCVQTTPGFYRYQIDTKLCRTV